MQLFSDYFNENKSRLRDGAGGFLLYRTHASLLIQQGIVVFLPLININIR
jgi:hypothetical protein